MPGDDEPVAAVVALAADDVHGALHTQFHQYLRSAAAGVLHEHDTRNAAHLYREAVARAHRLRVGQRDQPGGHCHADQRC